MAVLPWLTTAFFSPTLLLALYVLYKYCRYGLLGWLYVFNFCILRMIGNIMTIKAAEGAIYCAGGRPGEVCGGEGGSGVV
jgi:hypothetical protein